jgi:hypothetical protein
VIQISVGTKQQGARMGLRFRRSMKLFPGVRLNFSGGGISTTIGVRGASVTLGKRGTHLNVGLPGSGLSYRTRLFPNADNEPKDESRSPFQPSWREPAPAEQAQALRGEIRSAEVGSLTSPGLGEFKRLINEATLQRVTLSKNVAEREQELVEIERKLKGTQRFILRLFLQKRAERLTAAAHASIANLKAARAELAACSINVDFALDRATLDAFAAMVRVFDDLGRSAFIWDITSSVEVDRVRDRSRASEAITRTPVQLGLATSEIIDSMYQSLRFPNANGDDICIYPGFVLTHSKSGDFALIDVRELKVAFRNTRFFEEETVPQDTQVIDQTWKKTNKDGSPDKRFVGNYTIPVVAYGELWFMSPTGMNEAYMFSNRSVAENFGVSFANYQQRLQALARTSPASVEDHPIADDTEDPIESAPVAIVPAAARSLRWYALDWAALIAIACIAGFFAVRSTMPITSRESKPVATSPTATPAAAPSTEATPVPNPAHPAEGAKGGPGNTNAAAPFEFVPASREINPRSAFCSARERDLRSGPSPSAAVVSVASKGKQFTVFGREGEWIQVGEAAAMGWIHHSMVATDAPR